jgi:predicted aspartyl protease
MKYNDTILDPPGPVVSVKITPVNHSTPVRIRLAELDTGADISVIPEFLINELHLAEKRPVLMLGYDGAPARRASYQVDLEILGYTLRAVRVVAAPRATILLGRDVLKHFIITLDGKAQTFEMVDP